MSTGMTLSTTPGRTLTARFQMFPALSGTGIRATGFPILSPSFCQYSMKPLWYSWLHWSDGLDNNWMV
jgi:hypothetical protein